MIGRAIRLLLILPLVLVVAAGCGLQTALTPSLPEVAGAVAVGTTLEQAFKAPSNNLNRLNLGIGAGTGSPGSLSGGATIEVAYAPDADHRYPQPTFHDWPATEKLLPELTNGVSDGQSFVSPYPDLNGITVRIATFGGDLRPGEGRIKPGNAVTVLSLPVDGRNLGSLQGGTFVQVKSSVEGWAGIDMGNGQTGFVKLTDFASLPPAWRAISHGLTLKLMDASSGQVLRRKMIPASELHDNSHLTFAFQPIRDSQGKRYRFEISSPGAEAGSSVALYYEPSGSYADGQRYASGQPAGGDLVFNPEYASGKPLYTGRLDSFGWNGQTNSLQGSFPATGGVGGTYLKVIVTRGSGPLVLEWSQIRPPGGQPLSVAGNPNAPPGGLVFNATFDQPVAIGAIISQPAHWVRGQATTDPVFIGIYGLVVLACLGWFIVRLTPIGKRGAAGGR